MGWILVTALVLGLTFFPAFVGHAIGSERLTALAVAADGLHVLAAGTWLGSLGVMLVLFFYPGFAGTDRSALGELVPGFSAVALGSAAILVSTGLFASWLHLPSASALVGSGYGLLLLAKLTVVASVAGLGYVSWRRWQRSLRDRGTAEIHPRLALTELIIAHVVLALTAALVGTAPPGGP